MTEKEMAEALVRKSFPYAPPNLVGAVELIIHSIIGWMDEPYGPDEILARASMQEDELEESYFDWATS